MALSYVVPKVALAVVAVCLWVWFVVWWTRFMNSCLGQMVPAHIVLKPASVTAQYLTGFKCLIFGGFKSLARTWGMCQSLHLFVSYTATCSTEWDAPYRWGRMLLTFVLFAVGLAWSWFFLFFFFLSLLPLVARYSAILRRIDQYQRTEWEREVDSRPADHLFLGRLVKTGQPLVLHTKLLSENVVAYGPPGAHKSMTCFSLVAQLLAEPDPPAIFWVTAKQDLATMNGLHLAAARQGRAFNLFTLDRRKYSLSINLLEDLRLLFDNAFDAVNGILASAGLWWGESYGRSYFFHRGQTLLFEVFAKAEREGRFPANFVELNELLENASADQRKDADEVLMAVNGLAQAERLNGQPGAPRLDFEKAILNREVSHLLFEAASSQSQTLRAGGMTLYQIAHAAYKLYEKGQKARVVVVVDEAQNFLASNITVLLAQGRQFGCSFVLACQGESQLRTPDGKDFAEEVKDLARVRIHFAVTNAKLAQEVMLLSGEKIETLNSTGMSATVREDDQSDTYMTSIREYRRTRLEPEDLILLNSDPLAGLIIVAADRGHTQTRAIPLLYRGCHPIDPLSYYEYLESQPWPRAEEPPPPAPEPEKEKPEWIPL